MKRVLSMMACLPLLALVACSSDDEPAAAPESSESGKVYSVTKEDVAAKMAGKIWVRDYESARYFDPVLGEIEGERSFFGPSIEAFSIDGDRLITYTTWLPDILVRFDWPFMFREEDGFIYMPGQFDAMYPEMRIESIGEDRLLISTDIGMVSQVLPDGSSLHGNSMYAQYEYHLATPEEQDKYENAEKM